MDLIDIYLAENINQDGEISRQMAYREFYVCNYVCTLAGVIDFLDIYIRFQCGGLYFSRLTDAVRVMVVAACFYGPESLI